ncbi:hypothetical protein OG233_10095 [Streptomyces sp. NBC_01218]|uniref:hypothetical protein n=1 Tax=unclassified Streptomyces TaxID=2593676 RepID=UPI0023BA1FC6|nr:MULTISPECIES: hypothetical protein [unclassified Streptomyces]WEH39808.1 hypothetical protein PZB77_09925 [Streptomyces sp. AM 2-1-1]WSQ51500.1 hypothetical protein OG233_10095 [Streptomyces sp. NBC_01218]
MTVDPRDPETFLDEQPDPPGLETPVADAEEQRTEVRHEDDEPLTEVSAEEADEADVAEQTKVVVEHEDDYRP